MKFMHLGDLHIGKSLNDFSLMEDQKFILDQVFDLAQEKSVDGILIAGDVYDKSIPSEEAVRLFDYFICRLADAGLKTFIVSGNHDSDERLNFGSSLFEARGVYIAAKYEGSLACYELADEHGKLQVYLLPFVKASQVRHFFPEEEITTYESAVQAVLTQAGLNSGGQKQVEEKKDTARKILVAHQFVLGDKEDPVLSGSEGMAVVNVGTIEKISASCFDAFDYVALGHIHSGQRIGREQVRYSGSPLKYSLSEIHSEKSVPIVTIGEKGQVDIELVPLKPMRNLRHLKGTLAQLLDKKNLRDQEDFIYATLTDEDFVNDAMGIFQKYYPNTLKLDYDNSHTREIEQVDLTQIAENKSFEELIGDFYQMMYDCEMSQEERKLMKEVAREAGVSYEAD